MARGHVLTRPARARSQQGGFTLIELLVTVVVTTVGLIGLFGVFTVTSRGNAEVRQSAEALSVLEATADDLKTLTVAQFEATPPYQAVSDVMPSWGPVVFHEPREGGPDPYEGTGIVVGVTGTEYTREVSARRIDDDLVWIQVSVKWAVEGAALGTPLYDRKLAIEMVRSRTEGPL